MTTRQLPVISNLSSAEGAGDIEWGLRPDALARFDPAIHGAHDAEGDNVVQMYGLIGEDFWTGEGITARAVAERLEQIGARAINVHINSPGGDVFEGTTIFEQLRQHPHDVTIKIMGMAASIASVIAMAGDRILISPVGFMFVHDAWAVAIGNKHDLRKAADILDPIDAAIASTYQAQSGAALADIVEWMDKETLFSAQESVEIGLADGILDEGETVADEAQAKSMAFLNVRKKYDVAMQRAGASRSQARELFKDIKGKPSAARPGKPSAADPGLIAALRRAIITITPDRG